jgi:hypothetical protein
VRYELIDLVEVDLPFQDEPLKAALQAGVLEGVHMRQLEDRIEIVITDEDVDEDWQLRDLHATLRPYLQQVRQLDAQLVEVLTDTQ